MLEMLWSWIQLSVYLVTEVVTDFHVFSLTTKLRLDPCFLKPEGPVARLNIAAVMNSFQI